MIILHTPAKTKCKHLLNKICIQCVKYNQLANILEPLCKKITQEDGTEVASIVDYNLIKEEFKRCQQYVLFFIRKKEYKCQNRNTKIRACITVFISQKTKYLSKCDICYGMVFRNDNKDNYFVAQGYVVLKNVC